MSEIWCNHTRDKVVMAIKEAFGIPGTYKPSFCIYVLDGSFPIKIQAVVRLGEIKQCSSAI
jgi:hypothetical protein